MFLKIFYVVLLINLCSPASLTGVFEDVKGGSAAFFELPCMRIGGICAKVSSCPPGTRVGRKGLCPDQQQLGMECCRPFIVERKCRARHGDCMSRQFKCPTKLRVDDATDCLATEICCIYDHQ